MDETNENLFRIVERGDRHIDSLKEYAILLVGLSRMGKSATFNWILNKPMIGKGKFPYPVYEPVNSDDKKVAFMADTYQSVTLTPNIEAAYT